MNSVKKVNYKPIFYSELNLLLRMAKGSEITYEFPRLGNSNVPANVKKMAVDYTKRRKK